LNDDSLEQEEVFVQTPELSNLTRPKNDWSNVTLQWLKISSLDHQMGLDKSEQLKQWALQKFLKI